jgi:hypothetical protein
MLRLCRLAYGVQYPCGRLKNEEALLPLNPHLTLIKEKGVAEVALCRVM